MAKCVEHSIREFVCGWGLEDGLLKTFLFGAALRTTFTSVSH